MTKVGHEGSAEITARLSDVLIGKAALCRREIGRITVNRGVEIFAYAYAQECRRGGWRFEGARFIMGYRIAEATRRGLETVGRIAPEAILWDLTLMLPNGRAGVKSALPYLCSRSTPKASDELIALGVLH